VTSAWLYEQQEIYHAYQISDA